MSDIIEKNAAHNGNHVLYESKVYTSLRTTVNKGNGTASGGGSPSTADGDTVAFGCTEESLLHAIFGCKARGSPQDGAFVHATGAGWVRAHAGHYDDAIRVKQNTVLALIGDVFSGITAFSHRVLTKLAKRARDGRDGTTYGEYSTGDYYVYHAGAISMAVIRTDGERLEKGMRKIEAKLHHSRLCHAEAATAVGGA